MSKFDKETMNEWKKFTYVRTTSSQVLSRNACFVSCVNICGDGTGIADGALHNGVSSTDPVKESLRVIDDFMHHAHWDPPVYYSKGIHVEHGDHVEDITVSFIEEPKS